MAGAPGLEPGQPVLEAGVLPLNYTPFRWCFPFVSSEPLRLFRPALSPDQLGKQGAKGGSAPFRFPDSRRNTDQVIDLIGVPQGEQLVPRASIRTRVLLLTRQALFRLSYAGRGGSASI